MNLQIPVVGVDTGLTWELSINTNSTVLDGHNHSAGSGVQISPLGLDINTNLSFQDNQATNVYGVLFSSPAANSQNTFLYTNAQSGGGVYDLFFNDGAGNVIPITKAGIVNTIASSIPGESYSAGTFTWVQGAGSTTPANFDIGSIVLRPNTAMTTNGITLSPPGAIASAYSLVLPALPGSTLPMVLDSSGNITTQALGPTMLAANSVYTAAIQNSAVTTAKIADSAVTTAKLQDTSVTSVKMDNDIALNGFFTTGDYINVGTALEFSTFAQLKSINQYKVEQLDASAGVSGVNVISPVPATSALKMIRGWVAANGAITSGEGFTVSNGSTGVYTITFSVAFSEEPAVVATAASTLVPVNNSVSSSAVILNFRSLANALTNTQFSFIAIGQFHS